MESVAVAELAAVVVMVMLEEEPAAVAAEVVGDDVQVDSGWCNGEHNLVVFGLGLLPHCQDSTENWPLGGLDQVEIDLEQLVAGLRARKFDQRNRGDSVLRRVGSLAVEERLPVVGVRAVRREVVDLVQSLGPFCG